MGGSIRDYTKPVKPHEITLPNSGTQAQRLVTLSQTSSGKVLVWAGDDTSIKCLAGSANTVDANAALAAGFFIVKKGFARIVDVGSNGYLSVKALSASDESIFVEEVE